MKQRFKLIWISVIILLLDQATKLRVQNTMDLHQSIRVFGDFFRLTYVTNQGGAFSMSFGDGNFNKLFFTIVPFFALALIIYFITKMDKKLTLVAYFMVIGGALGNLTDRIAYGKVIDFLDVDFLFFTSYRFPVFNIADSAITIAIVILIIDVLFFSHEKVIKPSESQEIPEAQNAI